VSFANTNILAGAATISDINIETSLEFHWTTCSPANQYVYSRSTGVTPVDNSKCTFSFWIQNRKQNASDYVYADSYQDLDVFTNSTGSTYTKISLGHSTTVSYSATVVKVLSDRSVSSRTTYLHDIWALGWAHVCVQQLSKDRYKTYLNGLLVDDVTFTSGVGIDDTLNKDGYVFWVDPAKTRNASGGSSWQTRLARYSFAEYHFIDGAVVDWNNFAAVDANGKIYPKRYRGGHGPNGGYYKFSDYLNDAVTDDSGEGNDLTYNTSAFTTFGGFDEAFDPSEILHYAISKNSPSHTYATLNNSDSDAETDSPRNVTAVPASYPNVDSQNKERFASLPVNGGKFYAEVNIVVPNTSLPDTTTVGVKTASDYNYSTGTETLDFKYDLVTGSVTATAGSGTAITVTGTPSIPVAGDVVGIAVDDVGGEVKFYLNNVLQATCSGYPSTPVFMSFYAGRTSSRHYFNFGQRDFEYTPPANHVALMKENLPVFSLGQDEGATAEVYKTASGSPRTISLPFSPSLVMTGSNVIGGTTVPYLRTLYAFKNNSGTDRIQIGAYGDSISYPYVSTITDDAAGSTFIEELTSSGFVVGDNSASPLGTSPDAEIRINNQSGGHYISALALRDNLTSPVSNTDGTITSTVRTDLEIGMSVVEFNSTSAGTVGHGLSSVGAPAFGIGFDYSGTVLAYKGLWVFNTAGGNSLFGTWADGYYPGTFGSPETQFSSAPTSTVLSVPANSVWSTQTMFLFTPVHGFSACGQGTGTFPISFAPKFVFVGDNALYNPSGAKPLTSIWYIGAVNQNNAGPSVPNGGSLFGLTYYTYDEALLSGTTGGNSFGSTFNRIDTSRPQSGTRLDNRSVFYKDGMLIITGGALESSISSKWWFALGGRSIVHT